MTNTAAQSTRGFNVIFIHSSLDHAGLTPKEFRVFAHLSRRASGGTAWPSVRTIAETCLMSQSRVRMALAVLVERGFIASEERSGRTYLWTINPPELWKLPTPVSSDTPINSDSPTPVSSDSPPLSKVTAEGNPVRLSIEGNPIPEILDTPEFKVAWAEWQQHRKEKRKPITPTSRKKQLKELADIGLTRALAAIDYSIKQGWEGIYERAGAASEQKPSRLGPTISEVQSYAAEKDEPGDKSAVIYAASWFRYWDKEGWRRKNGNSLDWKTEFLNALAKHHSKPPTQ